MGQNKGLFDEIEESWIYGVELKPDFSGVIGELVALLLPAQKRWTTSSKWEKPFGDYT